MVLRSQKKIQDHNLKIDRKIESQLKTHAHACTPTRLSDHHQKFIRDNFRIVAKNLNEKVRRNENPARRLPATRPRA